MVFVVVVLQLFEELARRRTYTLHRKILYFTFRALFARVCKYDCVAWEEQEIDNLLERAKERNGICAEKQGKTDSLCRIKTKNAKPAQN